MGKKYSLDRFGRGVFEAGVGVLTAGAGVTQAVGGATAIAAGGIVYGGQAGVNATTGLLKQAGLDSELNERIHDNTTLGNPLSAEGNIGVRFGTSLLEQGGRNVVDGAAHGAYAGELVLTVPSLDNLDNDPNSPDYLKPGEKSQILFDAAASGPPGTTATKAVGAMFNPLGRVGTLIAVGRTMVRAEELLQESGIDIRDISSEEEFDRLINAARTKWMERRMVSDAQDELNRPSDETRASIRARILLGPDGWSQVGEAGRSMIAIEKFKVGDYAGVDAEWNAWRMAGGKSRLD